jgi:hypothetical protein
MKLDAKTVSVLVMPPGKTDHITRDSDLPGFGYRLRLGAGGKMLRSWIVQYRRASATRRLLLGSAGVLGAEAARTAAKKALAKVALGEDPRPIEPTGAARIGSPCALSSTTISRLSSHTCARAASSRLSDT